MNRAFIIKKLLIAATSFHIPHLPFNIPRHIARHARRALRPVVAGFVEVEHEGEHEISFQNYCTGILDIVVANRPADTLILIQQIIHRELDLSILLFENL